MTVLLAMQQLKLVWVVNSSKYAACFFCASLPCALLLVVACATMQNQSRTKSRTQDPEPSAFLMETLHQKGSDVRMKKSEAEICDLRWTMVCKAPYG